MFNLQKISISWRCPIKDEEVVSNCLMMQEHYAATVYNILMPTSAMYDLVCTYSALCRYYAGLCKYCMGGRVGITLSPMSGIFLYIHYSSTFVRTTVWGRDAYRICRICTYHFKRSQVYVETLLRLWGYRVTLFAQRFVLTPTHPLPSKNSPRYCHNFGNFLIRLSFAEAFNFLYGVRYQDVLKSIVRWYLPN